MQKSVPLLGFPLVSPTLALPRCARAARRRFPASGSLWPARRVDRSAAPGLASEGKHSYLVVLPISSLSLSLSVCLSVFLSFFLSSFLSFFLSFFLYIIYIFMLYICVSMWNMNETSSLLLLFLCLLLFLLILFFFSYVYFITTITKYIYIPVPVVLRKAVAQVSRIGHYRMQGWQRETTDGPKGGWSCAFWSGCNGCSGHLTHISWM